MTKMTIREITELVDETMTRAHCHRTFPIYIDKRMKTTLGLVRSNFFGIREMKISNLLLEHGTDEHIRDTIKHECAHAILIMRDPLTNHNHDNAFSKVCDEIGCKDKTGFNHYDELDEVITANDNRYKVYCKHCGTLVYSGCNRSKKIVDLLNGKYKHIKCGTNEFELR